MLRTIAAILAILACAKFGSHVYLYREATHDIIVTTYRDRALAACARNGVEGPLRVPPSAWSGQTNVELSIGKRDIDVYLWQVNHRLWEARYKNPYLVVTANAQTAHIYCEYDVLRDFASVHSL